MALVGANFPEMKTPAETGEITNTPVKDLLEQFKNDGENSQKDVFSDKGSVASKHSSSALKEVSNLRQYLQYNLLAHFSL